MSLSDAELEKHLSFALSLKSSNANARGPYLAEMHIRSVLPSSASSLKDCLVVYFQKFGDRHCFFEDTKSCFSHFDQAGIKDLVKSFRELFLKETNEKQQLMLVNVFKVETLNAMPDDKTVQDTVMSLLDHFKESFAFGNFIFVFDDDYSFSRDADKDRKALWRRLSSMCHQTDAKSRKRYWPRFFFLRLLAANGLLYLSLLQHGLDRSPCNYYFKCLLIKSMLESGMSEGILEHVKTLEIKHILLDTIGFVASRMLKSQSHYHRHIYMNGIENTGNYEVARSLMAQVLKIYDSNDAEVRLVYVLKSLSFFHVDIDTGYDCAMLQERNIFKDT